MTNDATKPAKFHRTGDEKGFLLASGAGDTGVTPAPSQYDQLVTEIGKEQDMSTLNGVECMKSAAFSSGKSVRDASSGEDPALLEQSSKTTVAPTTVGRYDYYTSHAHLTGAPFDVSTGGGPGGCRVGDKS